MNLLPAACCENRNFPEKLEKGNLFRPRGKLRRFLSSEINMPFVAKDLVLVVSRDCQMHYSEEIPREERSAMESRFIHARCSIPLLKTDERRNGDGSSYLFNVLYFNVLRHR